MSADDFNTYFYSVAGPEDPSGFGAVGRPWLGIHFTAEERQGGAPEDEYYFAMDVPGMGGRNSMDLCQAVHEGMLTMGGCLRGSETLRYSRPPLRENVGGRLCRR